MNAVKLQFNLLCPFIDYTFNTKPFHSVHTV